MILAAVRMGLDPLNVDDAKRQLEGGAIHPIVGAAMDKDAANVNNRLLHDASLIAKANIHAQHIAKEYGFRGVLTRIAAQAPRFSHGVSGWYWLLQFGIRILILVMYPVNLGQSTVHGKPKERLIHAARAQADLYH